VTQHTHGAARQVDPDQGPQRDLAHAFEPVRQGRVDRARLGDRIAVLEHQLDVEGWLQSCTTPRPARLPRRTHPVGSYPR
jgi:hypothetical protein